MMKYFLYFSTVAVSIAIYCSTVFAWCDDYPDVNKEYIGSELVFTGKVISEKKVHHDGDFYDGIYYTIKVIKTFRGAPDKLVTVFSENSSGRFPMEVGESYLVFTSIQPQEYVKDTYAISNCGNSGKLSKKRKALLIIEKLRKVRVESLETPDGQSSP